MDKPLLLNDNFARGRAEGTHEANKKYKNFLRTVWNVIQDGEIKRAAELIERELLGP